MSYFDAVIGQDTIKNHLTELVDRNMLPHSLLFYGESGLGKLDMAIGLASMLVGRPVFSQPKGISYLESLRARRIENGESEKKVDSEGRPIYIDKGEVFWLRPMKQGLKVEQWYTLLQDHLTVAGIGNRVIIVEDFQTANAIMANGMLKIIEEPPAQVYFIIITNKINTVLPTIVSRCMGILFTSVSNDTIRRALEAEGITENLDQALLAGHGNPGLVRTFVEQETIEMLELAVKIVDAIAFESRWFTLIALWTDGLSRQEASELMHWLRLISRDMMALKSGAGIDALQLPLYKSTCIKLLSKWSMNALAKVVTETLQAETALRLHIKVALIIDGLSIALYSACKED